MVKSCSNCYFGDKCPSDKICKHYSAIGEEAEDLEFEELIEHERRDFHREWRQYIPKDEE